MVFKVSYIVSIIWHGTCSLRCAVIHKPDSLPNFCPPNFRWQGWFPSSRLNNLRVRGDTWTGPSGTQTTEWRVFHLFFKLRNPPWDVCSATRKCDDRMGWSAAAFSASDQIHTSLQRPLTVQSHFSDDLHLRWTSPHSARTSYTSSWPENRNSGTGAAPLTKMFSHFAEDVYKSLGTGKANVPSPLEYSRRWAHPNSPIWEADLCVLWELLTLSWKPSDLLIERRAGHFLRRVKYMSPFWMS